MAELHKTVSMFRNLVPRAIKYAREAKRLKKTGALKRWGYSSIDEWLQTRYGWRILVYDIQDITKLISEIDEDQRTRIKERTGNSWQWTEDNSYTITGGHQLNYDDITVHSLSVRGSIIADFVPARININPVATGWELITLSFVIDWFLNVGQALEALSFLLLSDQYTASWGVELDSWRTVTCEPEAGNSAWSSGFHSNFDEISVEERTKIFKRVPCHVSKLPLPAVNLDGFKVMDLVAILVNFWK